MGGQVGWMTVVEPTTAEGFAVLGINESQKCLTPPPATTAISLIWPDTARTETNCHADVLKPNCSIHGLHTPLARC
jgi:hypothetical protein